MHLWRNGKWYLPPAQPPIDVINIEPAFKRYNIGNIKHTPLIRGCVQS